MIYSKKALEIAPSVTLSITAKAKKMKEDGFDIVSFGAGEPDFNTPSNIQEAAIKAMRDGHTKYTAESGILDLKKAICNKFKNDNNLNYNPSQIIVSAGAKQCLANTFQAILNPGDEVIIPTPYWVTYPELVQLYGGTPVFIDSKEDEENKITAELLEKYITSKTKAIVVNSPSNPAGTVYTVEDLKIIAEVAKVHNFMIISDEIYEKLIYDEDKHISIASLSEDAYSRTIVINGVSKSYAMTGWRIGYAAGNETVIKLMSNIQSHTTSNPTSIAQYASLEALNGDQSTVDSMIVEFKNRRDYTVSRINEINLLSCIKPKGAFYVMLNISKLKGGTVNGKIIKDSLDFASILLEEAKVAVVPGVAFGVDNYVRLSYATSLENIKEGLSRIEAFVDKIKFN